MQHILKTDLALAAFALSVGLVQAQDVAPLNSDSEPDRMNWLSRPDRVLCQH